MSLDSLARGWNERKLNPVRTEFKSTPFPAPVVLILHLIHIFPYGLWENLFPTQYPTPILWESERDRRPFL
jgi:hypothetical protein